MATREVVEEVVTEKRIKRVFSDFSGSAIPSLHWSAVTNIKCNSYDGVGNCHKVFDLDLMPEEMQDFKNEISRLISDFAKKYKSRRIKNS